MGQKGFFDVERRLEAISALGDPLETIKKIVPWLQRSAWSPARHQNRPRSGAHLGTSPALVRSAKAKSPKPAIVRGALLIDFGLDEAGEISQRILPAEIARLHRNSVGNALLHDSQLGADRYLLER